MCDQLKSCLSIFFFLGNLKGSGWQLDRNAELPAASADPAAAATLVDDAICLHVNHAPRYVFH